MTRLLGRTYRRAAPAVRRKRVVAPLDRRRQARLERALLPAFEPSSATHSTSCSQVGPTGAWLVCLGGLDVLVATTGVNGEPRIAPGGLRWLGDQRWSQRTRLGCPELFVERHQAGASVSQFHRSWAARRQRARRSARARPGRSRGWHGWPSRSAPDRLGSQRTPRGPQGRREDLPQDREVTGHDGHAGREALEELVGRAEGTVQPDRARRAMTSTSAPATQAGTSAGGTAAQVVDSARQVGPSEDSARGRPAGSREGPGGPASRPGWLIAAAVSSSPRPRMQRAVVQHDRGIDREAGRPSEEVLGRVRRIPARRAVVDDDDAANAKATTQVRCESVVDCDDGAGTSGHAALPVGHRPAQPRGCCSMAPTP